MLFFWCWVQNFLNPNSLCPGGGGGGGFGRDRWTDFHKNMMYKKMRLPVPVICRQYQPAVSKEIILQLEHQVVGTLDPDAGW